MTSQSLKVAITGNRDGNKKLNKWGVRMVVPRYQRYYNSKILEFVNKKNFILD